MLFICDNCGAEAVQQDEKCYICQACGAVYPLGYPIAKINSQIINLTIDFLWNYSQTCSANLKTPVEEAIRALEHTNLAALSRCIDRLISFDDSCEMGWMLKSMLSLWNTTYSNLRSYNEATDYAVRAINCADAVTIDALSNLLVCLMSIVSYATKVELLELDMPVSDKMDRYGTLTKALLSCLSTVISASMFQDMPYDEDLSFDLEDGEESMSGLTDFVRDINIMEKTMELYTAVDMWNQVVNEAHSMSDTQIISSLIDAYHMSIFASLCPVENLEELSIEYLYTLRAAREECVRMSKNIIDILEQAGLGGGADIFREPLRNDESNLAEIEAVIAEREAQEENIGL